MINYAFLPNFQADKLLLIQIIKGFSGDPNYALQILKNGRWKNYLLAAFYGGIAASVKYNAGLIVLCIVAAPLINLWFERPLRWKNNLAQSIKIGLYNVLSG